MSPGPAPQTDPHVVDAIAAMERYYALAKACYAEGVWRLRFDPARGMRLKLYATHRMDEATTIIDALMRLPSPCVGSED